jgi:hypothetical protein
MKKSLIVILVLVSALGCTAIQQQKSQAAAADDLQFKNLKVFPQNISRDQLIAAMRGFSRGLGVRCNFCHAAAAAPSEELDFASDAKAEKEIARGMLRMTMRINSDIGRMGGGEAPGAGAEGGEAHAGGAGEPRVSCWTCHRGHEEPEMPPPPPAQAPAPAH